MRAGVALASGWPEKGSVAGCTSAPMRARAAVLGRPVDRHEQGARLLAAIDQDAQDSRAMPCRDSCQRPLLQPQACRIVGVDLDVGLGDVGGEARREAGARHGVPLVADAAGVEHERPVRRDRGGEARRGDGDEARLAVGGEEAAVARTGARAGLSPARMRPLERASSPSNSMPVSGRRRRRCRRRARRRSRSRRGARARRRFRPAERRRRPRRSPAGAPPRTASTSRAARCRAAAGTRAGARCAARSW